MPLLRRNKDKAPPVRKTPDKVQKDQQALAARYRQIAQTEDGKAMLEDLQAQFMDRSSIVPGDPYATHAREGAREVVLYIEQMISEGE